MGRDLQYLDQRKKMVPPDRYFNLNKFIYVIIINAGWEDLSE
jgi:hypothetical protein